MAADACEDAEEDGLDDDFGQDVLADEDGEEVEEDRSDHDSGMEEHVIDLIENGKEEAAETAEGFEVAAPEIPVEPLGVPELTEERCTLQREPIGGWVYSNDSCELVGRVEIWARVQGRLQDTCPMRGCGHEGHAAECWFGGTCCYSCGASVA